jgi:hypothetical protein
MSRTTRILAASFALIACLTFGLLVFSLYRGKGHQSLQPEFALPYGGDERNEPLAETIDLRIRQYDNDVALVALENNTSVPIWVVYKPSTYSRLPAMVVYSLEQLSDARSPARALSVERFDAWPGCHALPSRASILFRANAPPRKLGRFRVVVTYLESPQTATLWNRAISNPDTFESVIERRDRELKYARSEWMKLPVAGIKRLTNAATRIAVNEPWLANPEDALLNNEIGAIELLIGAYLSGQTDHFYQEDQRTFCTTGELSRGNEWICRGCEYYMGYRFDFKLSPDKRHFAVDAVPFEYGKTGAFSFHMQDDGLIHAADMGGEIATVSDPPLFTNDRWQSALERDRERSATR